MIVIQLTGGLGNQLFQYALGRQLSVDRRVPLKLDISKYVYDSLRAYKLDCFNIQAGIATPGDIIRAKGGAGLSGKLIRRLDRLKPYYRRHGIKEQDSSFDANILQAPKYAYLQGYWQSEKYFQGIADMLRSELMPRQDISPHSRMIADEMVQTNSISVHVRRGDYVTNLHTHQVHGVCDEGYYQQAIQTLATRIDELHLYIFSDDMEWAREHLPAHYPATYVDHNGVERDYEDLWLMSHCKHHIIANSSFSWWGAWLSNNTDKTIIAPRKWGIDLTWDIKTIVPTDWIRI